MKIVLKINETPIIESPDIIYKNISVPDGHSKIFSEAFCMAMILNALIDKYKWELEILE